MRTAVQSVAFRQSGVNMLQFNKNTLNFNLHLSAIWLFKSKSRMWNSRLIWHRLNNMILIYFNSELRLNHSSSIFPPMGHFTTCCFWKLKRCWCFIGQQRVELSLGPSPRAIHTLLSKALKVWCSKADPALRAMCVCLPQSLCILTFSESGLHDQY